MRTPFHFSFLNRPIIRHLVFWIGYVMFTVGIYTVQEPNLSMHLCYELVSLPSKMLLVYGLLYMIYPLYIKRQKYLLALTICGGLFIVSIFFLRLSVFYIVYPIYYPQVFEGGEVWKIEKMISPVLDLVIVASSTFAFKLLREKEKLEKRQLKLQEAHIASELQLLKSQLHPHFLFNTLNSLYAYTLEAPHKAADIVLRLSDMLRFIIYESQQHLVPIEREISCIENYIELERLRYSKRLNLKFSISGEQKYEYVAPLVLLPFIENSFKHGGKSKGEVHISCEIFIKNTHLEMSLENSYQAQSTKDMGYSGVGLSNVKQRLTHTYGTSYQLDIQKHPLYSVYLRIPFKEVVRSEY